MTLKGEFRRGNGELTGASSTEAPLISSASTRDPDAISTGEEGGSDSGDTDLDIDETHPDTGDSTGDDGGSGEEYSGKVWGSGVIGLSESKRGMEWDEGDWTWASSDSSCPSR